MDTNLLFWLPHFVLSFKVCATVVALLTRTYQLSFSSCFPELLSLQIRITHHSSTSYPKLDIETNKPKLQESKNYVKPYPLPAEFVFQCLRLSCHNIPQIVYCRQVIFYPFSIFVLQFSSKVVTSGISPQAPDLPKLLSSWPYST